MFVEHVTFFKVSLWAVCGLAAPRIVSQPISGNLHIMIFSQHWLLASGSLLQCISLFKYSDMASIQFGVYVMKLYKCLFCIPVTRYLLVEYSIECSIKKSLCTYIHATIQSLCWVSIIRILIHGARILWCSGKRLSPISSGSQIREQNTTARQIPHGFKLLHQPIHSSFMCLLFVCVNNSPQYVHQCPAIISHWKPMGIKNQFWVKLKIEFMHMGWSHQFVVGLPRQLLTLADSFWTSSLDRFEGGRHQPRDLSHVTRWPNQSHW